MPSRYDKWNGDIALGWTPDADTLLELTAGKGDGEARSAGRGMDGSQYKRESLGLRFEKSNLGEVLDALQGGETLSRLSGLRVLNVNGSFFINSEQLETVDAEAADALCRYTELGQAELGDALKNPTFVEELTGLINQGYWYFDE